MLEEMGDAPFESRQAFRSTLDTGLEAPIRVENDEQSVKEHVDYLRDRGRGSHAAVEQARRQEAHLADMTL